MRRAQTRRLRVSSDTVATPSTITKEQGGASSSITRATLGSRRNASPLIEVCQVARSTHPPTQADQAPRQDCPRMSTAKLKAHVMVEAGELRGPICVAEGIDDQRQLLSW